MMATSPVNAATFRDRKNLALARLSEIGAPLLTIGARLSARGVPTPPASWRRGILLGADHIGDVLYNTASLPALAEALPECQWHFVATPPASEILANNPYVFGCVASPAALGSIDVALCYNSGGYWRELLSALRYGIPNRVGYVHKGFSALVTHPVRINYPQPYPAYFRDLVAQLTGRPPDWPLRPKIYPSSQNTEKAHAVWRAAELGGKPVIACFLTSRQGAGVWPARKFAETVAILEATDCCQTVLCGTASDTALLDALKTEFGLQAAMITGELDLLSLGIFLQMCAVVLCPDSGPRHLANAVRTPVVFVRNFAVGQIETGAYCETEIDAAPPDLERVAASDQAAAFERLRPEDVADLVRQRLLEQD